MEQEQEPVQEPVQDPAQDSIQEPVQVPAAELQEEVQELDTDDNRRGYTQGQEQQMTAFLLTIPVSGIMHIQTSRTTPGRTNAKRSRVRK